MSDLIKDMHLKTRTEDSSFVLKDSQGQRRRTTSLQVLPRDATQSAVMPQYVVCLSVCLFVRPSVRDFQVPWSHRSEYFENNLCSDWPQHRRSGARGTVPKFGVESWAQKPAIYPKRCKIGPKLLWRTNGKSHTRFRLVPKSMTLDDFERPKRTLVEKNRFTEPPEKFEWR